MTFDTIDTLILITYWKRIMKIVTDISHGFN